MATAVNMRADGVLFRSENIEVLKFLGTSDYLVVSFAPKNDVADGSSFWLKSVAMRTGISTIGFMPMRPNWYPERDVLAAIDAIRSELAEYNKIVVIGQSMGGYAALKYSAALGATNILSFAPQYSIDPDDVGHFDKRFIVNYREALNASMAVKKADVDGVVNLFFDPYDVEDRENIRLIKNVVAIDHEYRLPRTAHFPIMLFRGTQPMANLLGLCVRDDAASILAVARAHRRSAKIRILTACEAYAARNPMRAKAIFDGRKAAFDSNEIHEFYMVLVRCAIAAGHPGFANEVLTSILSEAPAYAPALIQDAKLALVGKDKARAAESARKLAAGGQGDLHALNEAGNLLLQAGALDEAQAALQAATAMSPQNAGILRRLSAVHLQKRQPAEALALAMKAIEALPGSGTLYAHLAAVLLQAGKPAEARDAARKALDLDPHDKNALQRLALAEQKLGPLPDAAISAK